MKSASEKEKIMQNLHKLKTYGNWLGLSMRDDFTINERKMIKEKCQEATNLNKGNNGDFGDFVWRVRGGPRTKPRLVQKARIPTKGSLTSLIGQMMSRPFSIVETNYFVEVNRPVKYNSMNIFVIVEDGIGPQDLFYEFVIFLS